MLTGKPDAGNPPVRFGGGGGELHPRSYPDPATCHHRYALGHPDPGFMLFKSAANARNWQMPSNPAAQNKKPHTIP